MPATKKRPSYLQRLQFDPKLGLSVVAKYITNIRLVLLLMVSVALLGLFSYFNLPKRLNPEVKIPIISVATVIPGAGPQDAETLVTIPLEDKIKGVKGIDTMTSVSRDNISFITIQFLSTIDRDKAKTDVQAAVDTVTSLPTTAERPQVTALDFEDQPIWIFALTSTNGTTGLMRFASELKNDIKAIPKVDRVITTGQDTQEVVVELSAERMASYGLNPLSVAQALSKGEASYPAGLIHTSDLSFSLTIDPSVETLEDIRQIRVQVSGKSVKLSDIAAVSLRSKTDQQVSYLANSKSTAAQSVTFYVYKTTDENIDSAGAAVKQVIDQKLAAQNGTYTLTTISNTSDQINKQFSDLLHEFRSTIILVFACLLLFLGLRQALISSFTVPLTFLSGFFLMGFFGMSINFLTLFAFLLALGLLVDDTIVTVSAMTTYYKTGKFTTLETGLLVWRDTIVPIWSTTITTIWSFVPLLLSTGIIGEFIKPIPIVVSVTMLSSTAIAVLITLPLMMVFLKPVLPRRVQMLLRFLLLIAALGVVVVLVGKNPLMPVILVIYIALLLIGWRVRSALKHAAAIRIQNPKLAKVVKVVSHLGNHGLIDVTGFSQWYKRKIENILKSRAARRKVLIAIAAYAVFSFALLPLGFVKNEFFPKTNQDEISVTLDLPTGTELSTNRQESLALLDKLRFTPESDFVTAEVGRSSASNNGLSDSMNSTYFVVHLIPKEHRKASSMDIAEHLRKEFAGYSTGTITVSEASSGPPAGSDLQIKLLGSDLGTLEDEATKVEGFLKSEKGVTNVDRSVHSGTSKLSFVPDQDKLADAGITIDQVGMAMRLYASGLPLSSINFDKTQTDTTDITFKVVDDHASAANLSEITLFSPTLMRTVPLLSLGKLEVHANPSVITREDGKREISVSASMLPGFNLTSENKRLEAFAGKLQLPTGYSWKTGGVNDENKKSVQSILQAMVVAAILIMITMVIQFGSFRQAIIVLIVIPLAVSSVFLAFALTGTPLSFPALIGVLSLFGIVVTNSMFIVDKINLNRKEGMGFEESIADAGASRMEPIILTKLCTVFGLLPITLADPLWRGLGGAIISGLLVASTIMLLFIPVLYYSWCKDTVKK